MPDLFLLTSADGALLLNKYIDSVGNRLRLATAKTFPSLKSDPDTVSVFILTHNGGSNIPLIQIIGVASWSFEKWFRLIKWKVALAKAWNDAAVSINEVCPDEKDKIPIKNVQVWPFLPFGSWGLVSAILSKLG